MQMFNRLDNEINELKNLKTVENTTELNNNSISTSTLPNKCLNNQNKEFNIKYFGTFSKYNIHNVENSSQNQHIKMKDNEITKNADEYKNVKNRELNFCNEGNAKLFDEPKKGEEVFLHTNEIFEPR
jgi:hypothetical protein